MPHTRLVPSHSHQVMFEDVKQIDHCNTSMATRHSAGALKGRDRDAPFPFFKLPAEVRNRIYVYAVKDGGPRGYICIWKRGPSREPEHDPAKVYEAQPAITKVCRELRDEALPLYYAENTFDVSQNRMWDSYHADSLDGYWVEFLEGEMVVPKQVFWRSFVAGDAPQLKNLRTIRVGCPFNLNVGIRQDNSSIKIYGNNRQLQGDNRAGDRIEAGRRILTRLAGNSSGGELNGLHLLNIASEVNNHREDVLEAVKSSPAWKCCNCELCQHWEDGDWQLIPSQASSVGSDQETGNGLPSRRQAGGGAGGPSQAEIVARLMATNMEV